MKTVILLTLSLQATEFFFTYHDNSAKPIELKLRIKTEDFLTKEQEEYITNKVNLTEIIEITAQELSGKELYTFSSSLKKKPLSLLNDTEFKFHEVPNNVMNNIIISTLYEKIEADILEQDILENPNTLNTIDTDHTIEKIKKIPAENLKTYVINNVKICIIHKLVKAIAEPHAKS